MHRKQFHQLRLINCLAGDFSSSRLFWFNRLGEQTQNPPSSSLSLSPSLSLLSTGPLIQPSESDICGKDLSLLFNAASAILYAICVQVYCFCFFLLFTFSTFFFCIHRAAFIVCMCAYQFAHAMSLEINSDACLLFI